MARAELEMGGDTFRQRIPCQWGFEAGYGGGAGIAQDSTHYRYTAELRIATNEPPINFYMLAGSWDPHSGLAPSGPPLNMSQHVLVRLQPIPEPSIVTLGVLGAAGLLLMKRSKRR